MKHAQPGIGAFSPAATTPCRAQLSKRDSTQIHFAAQIRHIQLKFNTNPISTPAPRSFQPQENLQNHEQW